jgi:hypothetical protein
LPSGGAKLAWLSAFSVNAEIVTLYRFPVGESNIPAGRPLSATTRRGDASRAAIAPPINVLLALLTGSFTQLSLRPIKAWPIKEPFLSEIIERFPFH